MNRDHLLGCRQYIPDVENGEVTPVYRKLLSVRQEKEFDAWLEAPDRDPKLTAFESGDWQPPVDGAHKVLPPNLTVSGGMGLLFSSIQRHDAEWGAVWNRVMRERVEVMMLAPQVQFFVDPAKIDLDMRDFEPYRIWSAAEMAPKKAQTATEVMLKMSAAQQRINDIVNPPADRFYGAQPEEWNPPPDEL